MDITDEAFVNAMADACRAGIESEQARIIKLLQDYIFIVPEFAYAVGLIKGEK